MEFWGLVWFRWDGWIDDGWVDGCETRRDERMRWIWIWMGEYGMLYGFMAGWMMLCITHGAGIGSDRIGTYSKQASKHLVALGSSAVFIFLPFLLLLLLIPLLVIPLHFSSPSPPLPPPPSFLSSLLFPLLSSFQLVHTSYLYLTHPPTYRGLFPAD
ncbi:hypothetical protein IWX92DRAFT_143637 [Phyllosticta citricarpa]